jgi:hypothetical protein
VARLAQRFPANGARRRYRVVIGGHPAPRAAARSSGGATS